MQKMTLKALRVNSGLSQESAAKKLGVSPSTLSKWENAKSFPDAIEIGRIEEYCVFYLVPVFRYNYIIERE